MSVKHQNKLELHPIKMKIEEHSAARKGWQESWDLIGRDDLGNKYRMFGVKDLKKPRIWRADTEMSDPSPYRCECGCDAFKVRRNDWESIELTCINCGAVDDD